MKVCDLIEKLKEYPSDLEIFCEHDFWVYPIDEEEFRKGYVYLTESGTYMELGLYDERPDDAVKALIIHQEQRDD